MNKFPGSDEEDDIESLRIAALQSLKKNQTFLDPPHGHYNSNFKKKGSRSKWGRFGPQGRTVKNFQGHFNNRGRTTNLISITPVTDESENPNPETKSPDKPETSGQQSASTEGSSKFNRYDKSDSESESEEEILTEDDPPGVLKKSDSLEALMQELDEEIKGTSNTNKDSNTVDIEKKKVKKFKKKKKLFEKKLSESQATSDHSDKPVQPVIDNSNINSIVTINRDQEVITQEIFPNNDLVGPPIRKRPRSRSPFNRGRFHKRQNQRHYPKILPQPHIPFNPPVHFQPQMMPFMNPQPNPLFVQPIFDMPPQFPPYMERPLSPLAINTESLTTATMAPLSPRSAAFVLQNKAIIEKRKRSPRRSYSRSPSRSLSRSPRRSLTPPRRSLTPPRRFRRSASPRRFSRSPPRRFSPMRKRSLSPRRRSVSPKRKVPVNRIQPKPPVHNRLGNKSEASKLEEVPVESKDKDKDKDKPKETEVKEVSKEEPPLDPVLAARKRKFESNELNKKEGIIRLKPKEEKPEIEKEDKTTAVPATIVKPLETKTVSIVNPIPIESKTGEPTLTTAAEEIKETQKKTEVFVTPSDKPPVEKKLPEKIKEKEIKELDRLLNDDIALEEYLSGSHKVADIFSDEESASDNEGRFKTKEKQGGNVPVLSFTKLVNGAKQEIKAEALPDSSRNTRRDRSTYNEKRTRIQPPSYSKDVKQDEEKKEKAVKPTERQTARQKITLNNDRSNISTVDKRRDRKIEIRIKNPSKYERKTKPSKSESDSIKQKIVIPIQEEFSDDSDSEEVIIEESDDSGDEDNIRTEGDLRTQLSRKRAEKYHKTPAERVSSRFLQFALQEALLKKSKKKSKRKSLTSSEMKLPIHYRLGLTDPQNIIEDLKVKKKKKRKNRELLEQV